MMARKFESSIPDKAGHNDPVSQIKERPPAPAPMNRKDPDYRTLGEYRDFCVAISDEDNLAVKFFDDKIKLQGRDEPVIAAESQMLALIASLIKQEKTNG